MRPIAWHGGPHDNKAGRHVLANYRMEVYNFEFFKAYKRPQITSRDETARN